MTATAVPAQRAPELVTPAGVLAYDGPAHTDAWYAARRAGITATDLVKIMGYSQYGTATSVWANKTGRLDEDPAGEAAQWGLDLEPLIARRWGERHATTVRPVGVLARHDQPHHRASLDGLVDVCPDGDGPCGVQFKCRSAFKAGDWRDDVPDDVYVQEQWECHVSGFAHMHVAVLIGGNTLRSLRVDRDHDDIAVLADRADGVWRAVLDDTPPPDRPSALLTDVLNRLYPSRDGQAVVPVDKARHLVETWRAAKQTATTANAAAKRAKAAVEVAEAAMVAELGDAEALFAEGRTAPVFTYPETPRAGYTVAPATTRQIRVNKTWDEEPQP